MKNAISHSLRRSSLPQKVTPRLRCALVNARTTLRLATNLLRDTKGSIPLVAKQQKSLPLEGKVAFGVSRKPNDG